MFFEYLVPLEWHMALQVVSVPFSIFYFESVCFFIWIIRSCIFSISLILHRCAMPHAVAAHPVFRTYSTNSSQIIPWNDAFVFVYETRFSNETKIARREWAFTSANCIRDWTWGIHIQAQMWTFVDWSNWFCSQRKQIILSLMKSIRLISQLIHFHSWYLAAERGFPRLYIPTPKSKVKVQMLTYADLLIAMDFWFSLGTRNHIHILSRCLWAQLIMNFI